jgi:tRNA pseudouridine65 synthase
VVGLLSRHLNDSSDTGPRPGAPLLTAAPGPLPFLYRDESLVIVNKPSGLSAHRGMASAGGDYVMTRVRDQLGTHVYLVHRLDRATSGAMALVTDARLVAPLQKAFEAGAVDKRYVALTRGKLPQPSLCVDYPIPRAEDSDERVDARTELTELCVMANRYALVEARPLTGRFHQIRRHLSHLRRPVLGDTTYGDRKENKRFRADYGLFRLALHARSLSLPHPVSGEQICVHAPLPDDLRGPLVRMGLMPRLER